MTLKVHASFLKSENKAYKLEQRLILPMCRPQGVIIIYVVSGFNKAYSIIHKHLHCHGYIYFAPGVTVRWYIGIPTQCAYVTR